MPVQEEPRLAACKQPLRDDTKRGATLFMEFLLYFLIVVESDALTPLLYKVSLIYGGVSSCLEALAIKSRVVTSA
jgi:hypothetical protein